MVMKQGDLKHPLKTNKTINLGYFYPDLSLDSLQGFPFSILSSQ